MADNYENARTMKNSPVAQPRSLSNHRPASGGAHRKRRLTPRFQAAKNAPGKIPGRFHEIKNPDFRRNQDFGAAGRIRTADLILTKGERNNIKSLRFGIDFGLWLFKATPKYP